MYLYKQVTHYLSLQIVTNRYVSLRKRTQTTGLAMVQP